MELAIDAGGRESELWWLYRRTGRIDLRNELVMFYEPWAGRRARAFARARGIDWLELRGAAAVGLIEAIERFDPSCGVPFRAFASMRIEGELLDAGRKTFGRESRRRLSAQQRPGRFVGAGWRAAAGLDSEGSDGGTDAPCSQEEALPSREPDPAEAAAYAEVVSRVLGAMRTDRSREVARRRLLLGESIDEVSLAVGIGKSRVHELIRREVLPRARATLRRMGLVPKAGAAQRCPDAHR